MSMDMTKGKPIRLLITFALPLILSFIFQQLYTLCDSIIVGQLLGEKAFAATSSSAYLDWFPLSMIIGLTRGFGVLLAQRYGAGDSKGFRRALSMSIMLAAALAVFLTVLGVCFLQPFLRVLKTPPELFDYTASYLRVLWLGLIVTALQNMFDTALRALGDSRTPLFSLILSTILNIALDYLFMAGFRMGVESAALATVLSRVASITFSLWRLRRISFAFPAKPDFKPHAATIRSLLRLGIPPLLSFSVVATGELAVQTALNLCGVAFVTGVTAAKRYYSLMNIIGSSLEGSIATFVGQNTGAGQMRRVFDGTRTAVWMSIVTSIITTALVALFSRQLILLFLPQGSAEVLRIGIDALRAQAILLPGLYLLCLYRAAIQGMGNTIIPMLSGFLELALRFACIWALPLLWGREGLYFINAVTWAVLAIMLTTAYYVIRSRIQKRLVAQEMFAP